jgi:serine protease AprX
MKRFQILILSVLISGLANAKSHKVAQDCDGIDPQATVDVIVQFTGVPTDKHEKKVKDKGGKFKSKLEVVKGALVSLPAAAIEALASDPDVTYITPDRQTKATLDYANPTVGGDYARSYGWNGAGIGVAVIDSGVEEDLGDLSKTGGYRIAYQETFVPGASLGDKNSHGSHVAGIIAGNAKNSTGAKYTKSFYGIAPAANIIDLAVLDQYGIGTDSRVISAIQRAMALKATYNIRVINLSLGRPVFESHTVDPLCQAVKAAWQAGIVVVVAAGNEGRNNLLGTNGYATINSPANSPYVITVGAMKDMGTTTRGDDLIASYSSKGPTLIDHIVKPDLVAPGNRIASIKRNGWLTTLFPQNLVPFSYYLKPGKTDSTQNYFWLSGTSMAAPMVSGAAALLLQKTPSLTPDQVKARLMKTASKAFPTTSVATDPLTGQLYTSQYDIFTVGAGYLDIVAALNSNDLAAKPALSPTAAYDNVQHKVYLVGDTSLVWGSGLIWGTSMVWGNALVWGNSLVWGDSVVWGDSMVWGDSATQGFSLIWGNGLIWGTTNQTSGESTNVAIQGEN